MIQLGQQFKIERAGYGQIVMTVIEANDDEIVATAEKHDKFFISRTALDYYAEKGLLVILEHQPCGYLYIDNEINVPCTPHFTEMMEAEMARERVDLLKYEKV